MKKMIVLLPVSLFFALTLLLFRAPSPALSSPMGFTNTPVPTDIPAPTETPVPTLQPTAVPTEQPTPQPTQPPSRPEQPQPTELPALGAGEPSGGTDTAALGQIRIPALGLAADLQAVPWTGADWDISTLSKAVGWLETTPGFDLKDNTYLVGHVDLKADVAGPFERLVTLQPGNVIFLKVDGKKYQYQVSQLAVVDAKDTSVMQLPPSGNLILITCAQGTWDEKTQQYQKRLLVFSTLVRVETLGPSPSGNRSVSADLRKP
jgi:LPXTG-site transpeptidase (sortase) family protein